MEKEGRLQGSSSQPGFVLEEPPLGTSGCCPAPSGSAIGAAHISIPFVSVVLCPHPPAAPSTCIWEQRSGSSR